MNVLRFGVAAFLLLQVAMAIPNYARRFKYPQPKYQSASPKYQPASPKYTKKDVDTWMRNEIRRLTYMIEGCYYPAGGFVCQIAIGGELKLQCIAATRVCDGQVDCLHGDDEYDCPASTSNAQTNATATQICCLDGSFATVCDGQAECTTNVDEIGCARNVVNCPSGQIKCPNGACATLCDGDSECCEDQEYSMDEALCRVEVQDGNVACDVLAGGSWCDDVSDCVDAIDETFCKFTCEEGELPCMFEGGGICAIQCDNNNECSENWDEDIGLCGECFGGSTTCSRRDGP